MFFQVGIQLLLVKNHVGAGLLGISVIKPTPLETDPYKLDKFKNTKARSPFLDGVTEVRSPILNEITEVRSLVGCVGSCTIASL